MHRCRWFRIERQPRVFKYRHRPVVNPNLKHPGPLAHQVHRHEIPFKKCQQVERIAGDRHLNLPFHLHRVDRWQAAHGQALQQSRTFPGWTAAFLSRRLSILMQALLVFLKFFPGDITRMSSFDQDLPLLLRHAADLPLALGILPASPASKAERPRVARMLSMGVCRSCNVAIRAMPMETVLMNRSNRFGKDQGAKFG